MYSEDSTTTEDIHRTQTQLIYDAKEFEDVCQSKERKIKRKAYLNTALRLHSTHKSPQGKPKGSKNYEASESPWTTDLESPRQARGHRKRNIGNHPPNRKQCLRDGETLKREPPAGIVARW
jgi:hypothetical protein